MMHCIAQHLEREHAALSAMSMVSRYWHACASSFIFRQVTVAIGNTPASIKQVDEAWNTEESQETEEIDLTDTSMVLQGLPWLEPDTEAEDAESDELEDEDDFDPDYVPSARTPQSLKTFHEYILETPIAASIQDLTIRAHKTTKRTETGIEVVELQPWITAAEFAGLLGCLPRLSNLHLMDIIIDPDYDSNDVLRQYGAGDLETLLVEYTGAIQLSVGELIGPLTLLCVAREVELRGFRCEERLDAVDGNPVICDTETLRLVGTDISPVLWTLTNTAQNDLRALKTLHLGRLVPSDIPTLRDVMVWLAEVQTLTLDFDFAHYTRKSCEYDVCFSKFLHLTASYPVTTYDEFMEDILVQPSLRSVNFNINWDRTCRVETWETCWPVLGHWLALAAQSSIGPSSLRYLTFKFGNFTDGHDLASAINSQNDGVVLNEDVVSLDLPVDGVQRCRKVFDEEFAGARLMKRCVADSEVALGFLEVECFVGGHCFER